MKIYLDGQLVPKEEAKLSVFDHGVLYGDGVFEGIRAYNGRVFRLNEHLDRFWASAKAVAIEPPMSKKDMEKAILETLLANNLKDAYIRALLTRGVGDLGLDPRKCAAGPSVVIIADSIVLYPPEFYEKGMEVITASTRRVRPDTLSPNIKSMNYLNNILAKMEAIRAGLVEAIMLNAEGYVAECTGDNLFIVKNSTVYTPPSFAGALEGITRNAVMELAKNKLNLTVKESLFTMYNVYNADECFVTGTAAEVAAVICADSRKIGSGKPGPITLKLMEEFRNLANSTGTPIK
ncbi:MAG: branched-chain-amino-acid transaminase [Elusimicrobiota bacterium]|jgi:branched-chain amino acid aminotransferase|nr:branched-chain-amino-acid transaminase [Elusimicrobiota bacterium]